MTPEVITLAWTHKGRNPRGHLRDCIFPEIVLICDWKMVTRG